ASKKFLEFGCGGIVIFDKEEDTNLSPEIYNNVPVVAYGFNRDIYYLMFNVNHSEALIMAIKSLVNLDLNYFHNIDDIHTSDIRQIAKKETITQYCKKHHIAYRIIDSTSLNAIETESSVKHFLQYNDLAQGVICGSYDITVGTINALGPNDHPILYSY